mmetsp:Transcript_13484/g.20125  ORF Transcript_13484/g.20125 Transcript_13484/m.20125 type:complete len:146 (+) Transcript_13484:464-901(+)
MNQFVAERVGESILVVNSKERVRFESISSPKRDEFGLQYVAIDELTNEVNPQDEERFRPRSALSNILQCATCSIYMDGSLGGDIKKELDTELKEALHTNSAVQRERFLRLMISDLRCIFDIDKCGTEEKRIWHFGFLLQKDLIAF